MSSFSSDGSDPGPKAGDCRAGGKSVTGRSVITDLSHWGPDSSYPPILQADAEQYCRTLAQTHYENFPVASWLLPRHLRQHFCNVYAYCRWADDLGDETGDRPRSLQLLRWWEQQLNRCYLGEAEHPVFVALGPTIRRYSIPREPFADLISAFIQDQTVLRYETFPQLLDYCQRSANPVGRIVLHLCERSTAENDAWSDAICTGLQLANFWQDVDRDLNIGRVYLPADLRSQFGYSDMDLECRRTTPEFLDMMHFLVEDARTRLRAGHPLIKKMPGRIRLDIDLFQRGGLLTLQAIERIGYRVWDQRPVVRKSELLRAAIKTLLGWT